MTDQIPVLTPKVLSDTLASLAIRGVVTPFEQHAVFQAAGDALAKAQRTAQSICHLPDTATRSEVSKARRVRAVRHGRDVYLPSWQDLSTALPNVLLRSSLWSVRAIRPTSDGLAKDGGEGPDADGAKRIPTMGDTTLINRGPALGAHDRGVFAACLNYYRDGRPLSAGGASQWIEVSYFKFLQGQGVSYHVDCHRALRASLERLSAISLHVRHLGLEVQIPRVLEVSFSDGYARSEAPKSSDLIYFRVLEPFAQLYGSHKWTAVPRDAIGAGFGLKSWLACFYSTHREPFRTKLMELHALTGSAAPIPKFKVQLRQALRAMQCEEQPLAARVAAFSMDDKSVTVTMAQWGTRTSVTRV